MFLICIILHYYWSGTTVIKNSLNWICFTDVALKFDCSVRIALLLLILFQKTLTTIRIDFRVISLYFGNHSVALTLLTLSEFCVLFLVLLTIERPDVGVGINSFIVVTRFYLCSTSLSYYKNPFSFQVLITSIFSLNLLGMFQSRNSWKNKSELIVLIQFFPRKFPQFLSAFIFQHILIPVTCILL